MTETKIVVENLSKTYRVPVRGEGLRAAMGSLFRRSYENVLAVQEVSFNIESGEMVGLIGPNGAGKTTTLKMLCGLLYPSQGSARVAGFVPWERKPDYLRQISMVLGNKSQMLWDIPPLDSFRILADIYGLEGPAFRQTLDELVALLEMEAILKKPVRNLSLGERMKCELVGGLLYRPQVLFLDEPTLGLDVSMQLRLRSFLAQYNRLHGVTVLLTSHYMADVMALCKRVLLIHHGRLLYDGKLDGLARQMAPFKLLRVSFAENGRGPLTAADLPEGVEIMEQEHGSMTLRTPRDGATALIGQLLQSLPVLDLAVEDPPIEAVMDQVYREVAS